MIPEIASKYQSFFAKNDAGKYFMEQLTNQIAEDHRKAENDPALARDYVQRAKGARQVIDHINSVIGSK
jgi:hypothetical protein